MEIGSLYYDIDINDSKLKTGLAESDAAVKSFGNRIGEYFSASAAASKQFALGLGVVGVAAGSLIGYGAQIAGDLESARQGFITLLGSASTADETIAMIKKDAAATPFELPGLIQANEMLTSITHNGAQSEELLLNVGKALAAMGKGQPELDRIIVNLQQIGAVGHASAVDLKQFAFSGIPIYKLLEDHLHITGAQLEDMTAQGKITFELLTDLFKQAGEGSGEFANAFTNQAGTFNQLMSNLHDVFNITISDIIKETGLFDILKKGLSAVVDFLNEHKDDIVQGIKGFFEFIKQNGPIILGILVGALLPAIGSIIISVGTLMATLAPWAALGAAVVLVAQNLGITWQDVFNTITRVWQFLSAIFGPALTMLWNAVKDLWNELTKLWRSLEPEGTETLKIIASIIGIVIIGAIMQFIAALTVVIEVIKTVIGWFRSFIDWVREAARNVAEASMTMGVWLYNFLNTVVNVINSVISWFANLPGRIMGAIGSLGMLLYNAGRDLIGGFLRGINDMAANLMNSVRNLSGNIVDAVKNKLGIHSPSTVFIGIGKDLTAGFVKGIQDTSSLAENAMNSLTGAVIRPTINASVPDTATAVGNTVNNNRYTFGDIHLGDSTAVKEFFERLDRNTYLETIGVSPQGVSM